MHPSREPRSPSSAPSSPVHERDVGIAAMVVALVCSLGLLGLARSLMLPGTLQGVASINPVGGTMGALMLVSAPASVGIWMGHARARSAALAGLLGGGAAWLFAGPLMFVPGATRTMLDAVAAAPPELLPLAGVALLSCLEQCVIGLPMALLIGGGLAWSGAALSPEAEPVETVPDPHSRSMAALVGVALAATVAVGFGLGLSSTLTGTVWGVLAAMPGVSLGPLFGPTLLMAGLAVAGWRRRRQPPAGSAVAICPVSVGAWSLVALLWAVGLPAGLANTLTAGLLPIVASTSLPASVDPATWNAMYDHTLVGLVIGLLSGLLVTTGATLFTPTAVPVREDTDPWKNFR